MAQKEYTGHDGADDTRAPALPRTTLADLRRAAGYSGKELAAAVGITAATYSRYERTMGDPDCGAPVRAVRAIADRLHCSMDDVVGRAFQGPDAGAAEGARDLNAAYRDLSESGRERLDEYLKFLELRDSLVACRR